MASEDHRVERLRAVLDELTAEEAAELLAQARSQARERVRTILADAYVDAMLDGVSRRLTPAPTEPPPTELPPTEPPPTEPPREGFGFYVYGVIGGDAAPTWTLPAIDRAHPVSTVREGEVAAVVSRIALEDFGEARLREHLADMGWVEGTARAHEGVLEQTRAQVTVIPMRMCTVYRDEDGVRDMLRREAAALTDALSHLDGKTEMGVKVFVDPVAASAPVAPEPEIEGPGAGAAYMELRRRERDRAEETAGRLERTAQEIHDRLCALADDAATTPVQRPEASGHPGEMILNGVYLVEDGALDGFRREVAELADSHAPMGLELALTGPWPAYNFVPGGIGAAW